MATASVPKSGRSSERDQVYAKDPSRSLLGRLWNAWREKRRKDRKRNLSRVRFRLTREGVHFCGILLFIFIGAIIRDLNLLILLAGAMIGLLLLQWRFNKSTLIGLRFERQFPLSTSVGVETEIETNVQNPKHWLGAWLVLLEDRITKLRPNKSRLRTQGTVLLDAVKPRGRSDGRYRLVFHERGKYRIGPTTMSTSFPMGLGKGWRILENTQEIIVRPHLGELLPRSASLFQQDQIGNAASKSSSGTQEGNFFGLRPWATGDSKRWVHWRTTARLGELSVRQFEQQMQLNTCLLLDFYDDDTNEAVVNQERALSFVATLAHQSIRRGRNRLSVALAGSQATTFPTVQSPVLVEHLLDELAVMHPSKEPKLHESLQDMGLSLLKNPNVLVVSTRPDRSDVLMSAELDEQTKRLLSHLRIRWLDVSAGDLDPYFQWEPRSDGSSKSQEA